MRLRYPNYDLPRYRILCLLYLTEIIFTTKTQMATRSISPIRPMEFEPEDKDRQIRKLKSSLAPLKQQLQKLPLLQQKLLHISESCAALQRETSISQGEYRLREESAVRAQQDLNENIIMFKKEQREVQLQLNDMRADNETLNVQAAGIKGELEHHHDLTETLQEKAKQLEGDTQRLRAAQRKLSEENLREMHKSQTLCIDNDELVLRTAGLKGKAHEIITDNKIFIEKISQFEDDNNSLDAKVSGKDEVRESIVTTIKKQELALALEQEREIELNTEADKLTSKLNHIKSNIKLEQEVAIDLNNQIRGGEKEYIECKSQVNKISDEVISVAGENESILKINYQLKKDWDACESHLMNLVAQHKLLNSELEKYVKEDDFVLKLIMERRKAPVNTDYVLKSSRVTQL